MYRRDTRSRLLKLSGFLGEQRQLRRLGETGPYKDNEVRGTYDSTRLVSSAAFQQGPVTFYVRTRRPPTRPNVLRGNSAMSVTRGHSDHSLFSFQLPPAHLLHSSVSISHGFPSNFRSPGKTNRQFPIFEQSRKKSGLSRCSSSAKTGFTTGFWQPPTLLPFALLLRFFSRCRAPFDFAIPRKRKFLLSRFFLLSLFPQKAIKTRSKTRSEFYSISRNRIFFFNFFSPSDFPVPTFSKERKKERIRTCLGK